MRDAERRPDLQNAIDDLAPQNDGVLHVKHMILRDLEQGGKYGHISRFVALAFHDLVEMPREVTLEVVNDVRRKDLDLVLVRVGLRFGIDGHVKPENARVLLGALLGHDRRLDDVLLVDGADRGAGHGYWWAFFALSIFPGVSQELEQGF